MKFKVTRAVSALTTKEIRAGDPAKDVRNKEEVAWVWEEGGGDFRGRCGLDQVMRGGVPMMGLVPLYEETRGLSLPLSLPISFSALTQPLT